MSVLVSVIVPVYNSERYISDCIESVLNQSFNNYELIVVDDGSTDNTHNILKKYENKNDIKVIQIEHSGQSVARNVGIENSKGKYIIFIDSDDCWTNNTLDVVVPLAEEKQLDMVLFDGTSFLDEKISDSESLEKATSYFNKSFRPDTYVRHAPSGIITGSDYLSHQVDKKRFIASPVLYLYNRHKYKDVKFVPGIIHEDNAFTMELQAKGDRIMAAATKLYCRRVRNDSIMTTPDSMVNVLGYIGVIERMTEVYNSEGDVELRKTIINLMCMTLSNCARTLRRINVENY